MTQKSIKQLAKQIQVHFNLGFVAMDTLEAVAVYILTKEQEAYDKGRNLAQQVVNVSKELRDELYSPNCILSPNYNKLKNKLITALVKHEKPL